MRSRKTKKMSDTITIFRIDGKKEEIIVKKRGNDDERGQ